MTKWLMNAEVTSSDYQTVAWAKYVPGSPGSPSGDFQLTGDNGDVYEIGASSTTLDLGDGEYILYLDTAISRTGFQRQPATTYISSKNRLKIATMKAQTSASGLHATYELETNIALAGGANTRIKATPDSILSPVGRILSGDGTNSAPTFSFTSDPNTGVYQFNDDQLGLTVGGSAIGVVTTSGLLLSVAVASDIEMNIGASSGLVTKVSSSKRYKDNIADLDINTENIYDLRPVSFDWKSNGKSDFGYIAEEVHDILPELVVYDGDNLPEAVKYKQLSVLMLEELKKLREEVKTLKEKI